MAVDLKGELERLREAQLYRARRVIEGPPGPQVRTGGRSLTAFCGNDYLGLAGHPDLRAAVKSAVDDYGVGSGAAHLVTGHSSAHQALEEELADFLGRPRALLFSTGYMANLGVISALAARGDQVCEDRLNHASLIDGAVRYQLLESIREFAHRQLVEAGEAEALQERHAAYHAACAETLQAMQRAGKLADALRSLDDDEAEFRSALRFTTDTRRDELAGRLVAGLGYLWYAAGLHREGFDWCRSVLDAEPDLSDEVRAGVLHSFGVLVTGAGHPELGVEAATEQVALRRRLGDPARLGAALNNLGNYLVDIGDVDGSEPVFAEAAEIYRDLGDAGMLALVRCSIAWGHYLRGRIDDAASSYRDALANARAADNPMSIAVAMAGLGQALVFLGDTDGARPHVIEARERFVELSVGPGIDDTEMSLGLIARREGRLGDAARHWRTALTADGGSWYEESNYWTLGYVASILDDLPTAAVLVGAATAAYEATRVAQVRFVLDDLAATRAHLEAELGPDEFGVGFRAGGRRSKAEAIAIGVAALDAFLTGSSAEVARSR